MFCPLVEALFVLKRSQENRAKLTIRMATFLISLYSSVMKTFSLNFVLAGLMISNTYALEVLPKRPPEPVNNRSNPSKVSLGQKLYFDPRLSKDGTISCNSCHNVMAGGDDNRAFSVGVGGVLGGRSSPTVFNAAFLSVQFWDGRAASLEEQAKGPLTNPKEMAMPSHDAVIARLNKIPGYVDEFTKVFGKIAPVITIDKVVQAIAAYERTLITPKSPVDRYVSGERKALSELAIKGMKKVEEVGCLSCHSGPNYAGPTLPEGVGFYQKFPVYPGSEFDKKYDLTTDQGRYEVTKQDADRHVYRVPTWRNIALTAPYFHNGSVKTLPEAVRLMGKTQLNKDLNEEDVTAIVAFLEGLSGEFPKETMPRLPPTVSKTFE